VSAQITPELARKVQEVVDHGLVSGLGQPAPGRMCVEAAVCYALGEPHGDRPSCVHPYDRAAKVRLNDAPWSSDAARAAALRRVAVMQLGTVGLDRSAWAREYVAATVRLVLSNALREGGFHELAARCGAVRTVEDARDAAGAAYGVVSFDALSYGAVVYVAHHVAAAAGAGTTHDVYVSDYDAVAAAAYAAVRASDAFPGDRDRALRLGVAALEEAYERTGSPGLDALKALEAT
jgi:hypothetical protein